ncbi:MAG: hypothetical protein NTX66_04015 [Candidatus Falkowbacteria bacterium]|nr:hypothetical protein [Candidatus Falkowbacteria bacterium]
MPDSEADNSNHNLRPRPVVLLLLDGWGLAPAGLANIISSVKLPTFDNLISEYPVAALATTFKSPALSYLTLGGGRPAFSLEASYDDLSTLTKVISAAGLKQALIAESEKFALTSYFLKGKNNHPLLGEDQFIVSSKLGHYEEQPGLVLPDLVNLALKKIKSQRYDFILLNISNLDLLAAIGDKEAIKKSLVLLDKNLARIVKVVLDLHGALIITSAHGNAEKMLDLNTDSVDTDITDNPVPLIIVSENYKGKTIGLKDIINNDLSLLETSGSLCDLAPTIIKIMNLTKPADMSGESLI